MGNNNNQFGINNNNNFRGSYNNFGVGNNNNSNNKGSGITYSTNSSQKSLMKYTLPQKKWIIFLHQLKLIIMMHRKVSHLTEIIKVAETMIVGEIVLIIIIIIIIMEEITIWKLWK